MIKLRYQWGLFLLSMPFVWLAGDMSLSVSDPVWYHYLTWQFCHGSLLHWLLNGFSWIMLWRVVTPLRLILALLTSALCAAFYYGFLHPAGTLPLCGFSGVISWFIGLTFYQYSRKVKANIILVMMVSFCIPHIASLVHCCCFLSGILYYMYYRHG